MKYLGISQDDLLNSSPRKKISEMIKAWYSKNGSEEEKRDIISFAADNNLTFMCPPDWFTEDFLSKKSQLSKADQPQDIDYNKYVFNIITDAQIARFIRALLSAISKSKEAQSELVIKIFSGEEELSDKLMLTPESNSTFEVSEDYFRSQDSSLQKADLNILFRGSEDSVRNILDAIKEGSVVVLDPEGDSPVTQEIGAVSFDDIAISEPDDKGKQTLFVSGTGLGQVSELFNSIGELGNGGHSFDIVVDGEKTIFWDGDGSDYIANVDLKKCNAPSDQTLLDPFDSKEKAIQETISMYGATVQHIWKLSESEFCVVLVDDDSNLGDISESLESFGFSLVFDPVQLRTGKLLIFSSDPFIFEEKEQQVEKAKKGTDSYDKWLAAYREKRSKRKEDDKEKSKEKALRVLDEFGFTRDESKLISDFRFAQQRAENEDYLDEMLKRPSKKQK